MSTHLKATIKNGTECRFSLRHLTPGEFGDDLSPAELESLEGRVCLVEAFATGEAGERDFEYYDIRFLACGTKIAACSGFHLTPLAELKEG